MAQVPDYEPTPLLRFLRKHIWLIAGLLGVVTLSLIRPLTRHVPEPPPVLFQLPAFDLVDENGEPFTLERMEGEIWIASFVFTSCPSSCPVVTAAMKTLQDRIELHGLPVKLVSFSVDPQTDTPEVLSGYARAMGANPAIWTFVTGELEPIRALVEEGFHLGVGQKETVDVQAGLYDIAHSTKVALVGPRGGVRGYYGIDELGRDEVFHRAQHLLREENRR